MRKLRLRTLLAGTPSAQGPGLRRPVRRRPAGVWVTQRRVGIPPVPGDKPGLLTYTRGEKHDTHGSLARGRRREAQGRSGGSEVVL